MPTRRDGLMDVCEAIFEWEKGRKRKRIRICFWRGAAERNLYWHDRGATFISNLTPPSTPLVQIVPSRRGVCALASTEDAFSHVTHPLIYIKG